MPRTFIPSFFLCVIAVAFAPFNASADEWSVSLAGNAYRTAPEPGGNNISRNQSVRIMENQDVVSAYIHFDRPAKFRLSLTGRSEGEPVKISVKLGNQQKQIELQPGELQLATVGDFDIAEKGYAKIDLQKVSDDTKASVELRDLRIESKTDGLSLDYVRNNDGNMFYWGRRGPSVHLGYRVPRDAQLSYAYNEITVPPGEDPLGTYYMAVGFGEGYFGIQVNGPEERRVLFSVWSPFNTDNPKDIPEDQRIEVLGRGPGVHIGEFGNEGSGGQSYLVYPWKAGKTYRFLVEVIPGEDNKTTYTAWFGDKEAGTWQLVASFRRPKTNTHLRGFHSFLESFSPTHGFIGRRATYGNQWVRDVEGQWYECTEARFTVDATGGGRHRLDFTGGSEGKTFFLQNCGFFAETGKPGTNFTRESTVDQKPQVDPAMLPR